MFNQRAITTRVLIVFAVFASSILPPAIAQNGGNASTASPELWPHTNHALQLRARLARLEGLSKDLYAALDQADHGIVLFDREARCAFVNRAGMRLLDQRDGLVYSDNRLAATDARERAVLAKILRRIVSGARLQEVPGGGTIRVTRQRGRPIHLRITPFPTERLASGSQFAAIALIGDPERAQNFPLDAVKSSYGLTPAEARLAQLLLEGKSVAEAAAVNRVTKETARSQLKSIFHKTGTKRQGDLIGLLTGLPGVSPFR